MNINTLLPFHSTEKKTGLFQFHGPRKGAHVLSFNILGPFKKIVYYELADNAEVFLPCSAPVTRQHRIAEIKTVRYIFYSGPFT